MFNIFGSPKKNTPTRKKSAKRKVKNRHHGTIKIEKGKSPVMLQKHQKAAVEKLETKITNSKKRKFKGLLVLPTGAGKTLTIAYWIARNYLDKDKKMLWIAHRHELLEQAKNTFHKKLAYSNIFRHRKAFDYHIISGVHDKPVKIKEDDDIIFSIQSSLQKDGLTHLNKNWLKNQKELLLVIDEAHHAPAATYRKIIENVEKKLKGNSAKFAIVGLTATPTRTAKKEKGWLKKVFPDDIIYKIDYKTLISKGILSEPKFEELKTNFDMIKKLGRKHIQQMIKRKGDIDSIGKEAARSIAENAKRNMVIVNRYKEHKDRYQQTLVFALNQANAIALNILFQKKGIKSDYVISGEANTSGASLKMNNGKKIARFKNQEIDVLINVNILTEGADLPKVQSIFLARPTKSEILMSQMIGRGLRGPEMDGLPEAFIVSFIDNWKNQISWVNPEQLFIQENVDFGDDNKETRRQLTRLISIKKMEEFASLADETMKLTTRGALEKLEFIQRIPVGIYHFSILKPSEEAAEGASVESCEVLVYDSIQQPFENFMKTLRKLFIENKLTNGENLTEDELNKHAEKIHQDFFDVFDGEDSYPGYGEAAIVKDVKDILQYYAQKNTVPPFIKYRDREKYNIAKEAKKLYNKNLKRSQEKEEKDKLWESNKVEWNVFFSEDKKNFIKALDLEFHKLEYPDLDQSESAEPKDVKKLVDLESLSMNEIKEEDYAEWKRLHDAVYKRHQLKNGYYKSAISSFKSKNKRAFQIDHIKSRSNGGLTKLSNLQLLTRSENARKGSKVSP